MKFKSGKTRGYSRLYWVIADKLSPHVLAVYHLIKSFDGYAYFDLSIRQIAKATGMSIGKAQDSFTKLKDLGVIRISKKTEYWYGDEYEICDEEVAQNLDPDFSYNSQRKSWSK
jgi:predicted transcriptional regulator